MSDATWDHEYSLASDYYSELKVFCASNNIPIPDVGEYPRSWELRKVLEDLKASIK